ncbi:MAG: hypothetical protein IJU40_06800, partial [Desulfovibrionaceae bacterium]|nr:hypothetical protein [Desulfovibrionaceae bacterium]
MKTNLDKLTDRNDLCSCFINILKPFFNQDTPAAQAQLVLYCVSIFVLNCAKPLRFLYDHFLNSLCDIHLNNYYNTINNESHQDSWRIDLLKLAVSIIPPELRYLPFYFIIDDTLVEKYGKKFDTISELYDHCLRNGSEYIFGH